MERLEDSEGELGNGGILGARLVDSEPL